MGAPAHAESALPTLTFTNCAALAENDVRRITSIELAGGATLAGAQVLVACQPGFIQLRAVLADKSVEKVLPVSAVDEHSRPRLVALATAELLHELARLMALPPSPPAARVLPPPPEPERWDVTLGPLLSAPTRGALLLPGGALAVHFALEPWFALGLGFEFAQGSRDISGGSLRLRTTSLALGLRFSYGLGLLRPLALLELLGSLDALSGSASDASRSGDSFTTRNLGARLSLGVELPFAAHGLASLTLGLMRKARALHAANDGAPTTEIGPWYASAKLALGARW